MEEGAAAAAASAASAAVAALPPPEPAAAAPLTSPAWGLSELSRGIRQAAADPPLASQASFVMHGVPSARRRAASGAVIGGRQSPTPADDAALSSLASREADASQILRLPRSSAAAAA